MFKSIVLQPAPPFVTGMICMGGKQGRVINLFPRQSPASARASILDVCNPFTFPDFVQPPGTVSAGGIAYLVAAFTLAVGDVVVTLDGITCVKADKAVVGHAGKVYGVVTTAAPAGALAPINTSTVVENGLWNWVVGADVYVGVAGQLTAVADETATFIQRVGYAVSPTKIMVSIADPLYL